MPIFHSLILFPFMSCDTEKMETWVLKYICMTVKAEVQWYKGHEVGPEEDALKAVQVAAETEVWKKAEATE